MTPQSAGSFFSVPSMAHFKRVKVPSTPGSGKCIANGKGVHREVESERSRMANRWPDEQKSHEAYAGG